MDRSTPEHNSSSSHKRLSMSFLVSMMVLCARHANRLSKKLKLKSKKRTHSGGEGGRERFRWNMISSSMSSPRPKELFTALSNKAMRMVRREKTAEKKAVAVEEEHGLWQKEILMGGKCEPLDFSGVIYYDCNGRLLNEVPPRSPRGTLLPSYPTRS